METYHLEVAGLERELPVCPLGNGVSIAGFVMFSDVELTIACATELLKRVPEHDVLLTAESKGIPLAYEMSRQSGKRYILARKIDDRYVFLMDRNPGITTLSKSRGRKEQTAQKKHKYSTDCLLIGYKFINLLHLLSISLYR